MKRRDSHRPATRTNGRSATVQAEIATVAYELPADAFERLKVERPALAQALFTFVIGIMAERLSFASRVIGVLQR